jgi:hypothetical protein
MMCNSHIFCGRNVCAEVRYSKESKIIPGYIIIFGLEIDEVTKEGLSLNDVMIDDLHCSKIF